MNICLFTSSFLPVVGGREMVVHNLATALSEMGHRVVVLVPFSKIRGKKNNYNYRIVQFGFRGYGTFKLINLSMIVTIIYIVWKYKIDIINVHGVFKAGTWAYLFSKICRKIPIIGTPHGDDIQVFPELNYGVRIDPKNDVIVRRNVKSFHSLTAISKSIRRNLEEIVSDDKCIVNIPNGIWTLKSKSNFKRYETKKKFAIPNKSTLLISIGRNHPIKGFGIGVEALARLTDKHYDISYLIIGRNMDSIRELAKSLGVGERLFTPGQLEVKAVAELLRASDIYISPSLIESFGLTTIEAMSAGLPCVVTDIEGSRDIVSSEFGIITRPGDGKKLAEAIQYLIENKAVMKKMGQLAHHESLKYDWLKIAKDYENVYRETIDRKICRLGCTLF